MCTARAKEPPDKSELPTHVRALCEPLPLWNQERALLTIVLQRFANMSVDLVSSWFERAGEHAHTTCRPM